MMHDHLLGSGSLVSKIGMRWNGWIPWVAVALAGLIIGYAIGERFFELSARILSLLRTLGM